MIEGELQALELVASELGPLLAHDEALVLWSHGTVSACGENRRRKEQCALFLTNRRVGVVLRPHGGRRRRESEIIAFELAELDAVGTDSGVVDGELVFVSAGRELVVHNVPYRDVADFSRLFGPIDRSAESFRVGRHHDEDEGEGPGGDGLDALPAAYEPPAPDCSPALRRLGELHLLGLLGETALS